MKKIIKLFLTIVCFVSLVACGKKEESVQVKKEGTIYEIGEDITFYYPDDFELSPIAEGDSSDNSVIFKKENQVLFYKVEDDAFDNETNQKVELYKGELEVVGAKVNEVKEPALESGLKCYEYIGEYSKTGLNFTHLVYFEDQYTYIYGYEANETEYNENIDKIIVYLETFTKSTGL